MKIDAAKLRTYLDTMHGHANARDVQSESIRKVIKEARSDGFDGKAMRKIFVRERMEPEKRQREDDIIAAYQDALGGKAKALAAIERGATLDEAAEAGGVHRATVARANAVAKQASIATPHDPITGELTEVDSIGDDAGHRSEPSSPADIGIPTSVNADPPSGQMATIERSQGEQSGTHSDDGMDIPSFLRSAA